jgi:hypothetical protein
MVMTVARLINPAFRAGLLMVAGTGMIIGPLLVGAGPAAIVTGVVLGILATALALTGTALDDRGTLPLSAQAVYDRGLALGLLATGLVFGISDQPEAAGVFGAAGLMALVVTTITRYSARTI